MKFEGVVTMLSIFISNKNNLGYIIQNNLFTFVLFCVLVFYLFPYIKCSVFLITK